MKKNALCHVALCLGVSALATLVGGCAAKEDPSMGMTGGMNRRPYTPNFFDGRNSAVQYFESTRTAMIEGTSPLTENTFSLTPEQRSAIEQLQRHRELQQELNW